MPSREDRSLPARIQGRLSRLYGISDAPPVDDFIEASDHDDREVLVIVDRGAEGEVELALHLPRLAEGGRPSFDQLCQIVEGVSHFLYVVERARRELPATQLELELQAEVDKYVILAASLTDFDERISRRLRERLYDDIAYMHEAGTELGDRYRMANGAARRFTHRLERDYVVRSRFGELQGALRRFFHMGQGEKLRAA